LNPVSLYQKCQDYRRETVILQVAFVDVKPGFLLKSIELRLIAGNFLLNIGGLIYQTTLHHVPKDSTVLVPSEGPSP
jgi:hypothetical protein